MCIYVYMCVCVSLLQTRGVYTWISVCNDFSYLYPRDERRRLVFDLEEVRGRRAVRLVLFSREEGEIELYRIFEREVSFIILQFSVSLSLCRNFLTFMQRD